MTFMYLIFKVGMKTVKKEHNYGRETKMLPVNKVAKKRAKSSVHGHFFVSRGKKKHRLYMYIYKCPEKFLVGLKIWTSWGVAPTFFKINL